MSNINKKGLYSALVWLLSALFLFIYCLIGLFKIKVPGVEDLVLFISNANGIYFFIAAFLVIFIEGLYVVGTFFPGSTLVAIVLILSQGNGLFTFLITTVIIFIGWSAAGIINICGANFYRKKIIDLLHDEQFDIKDKSWTTWFPVFRSNYEVAQVVDGGKPWQVFLSSLKVRFYACTILTVAALIVPYFIDIKNVSNEEGFVSLFIIALITLIVGVIKLKDYFTHKREDAI